MLSACREKEWRLGYEMDVNWCAGKKSGRWFLRSFKTCWQILQKYSTTTSLTAISFSTEREVFQQVTLLHSINREEGGLIEKNVDGGLFLSKMEGERTGMYRQIWSNGKKEVRRGTDGCGGVWSSLQDAAAVPLRMWNLAQAYHASFCMRVGDSPKAFHNLYKHGSQGRRLWSWLAWECNWKFMSHGFLVGHGGEGPEEPQRKAKVSPGGRGWANKHTLIHKQQTSRQWSKAAAFGQQLLGDIKTFHYSTPDHNCLTGRGKLLTIKRKKHKMEMKK